MDTNYTTKSQEAISGASRRICSVSSSPNPMVLPRGSWPLSAPTLRPVRPSAPPRAAS